MEHAVRAFLEKTMASVVSMWHTFLGLEIPHLDTPTVLVGGTTFNMLVALILFGVIALLYFGVRNRTFGWNTAAFAAGLAMTAVLVVSHAEQLSHPKKLSGEWVKTQAEGNGVEIFHVIEKPPEKFHLWINVEGSPRSFWVVWTQQLEKSLQEARKSQKSAGKEGRGSIWLKYGKKPQKRDGKEQYEPSLEEEEFYFHLKPWPAPPPKDERPISR